ncbi:MAG: DUF4870 domain-containing protein [Pseudomonadota bacterium]|nr:DUF4870 domain-containing protein [Pseudomonadota bacterium]
MSDYAMTWGETPTSDDKMWALIAHLSVFMSAFLGPLVVLLVFQDKSKFIRYHAIQALMVQVSVVIAGIIISVISFVTCGLGSLLYLPLLCVLFAPLWGAYLGWSGAWAGFPGLASVGR